MLFDKNTNVNEVILACRQHNDAAFAEIVRRYTPLVRKLISVSAIDFLEDSELFSEGCVALHQAAMSYDLEQGDVTFGLYARVCIYRHFIDVKRRYKALPEILEYNVDSVEGDDSPDAQLVERERIDGIIDYAKAELSDYEYSVFLLHIQGYKTAAIAERLNKTSKSVDNAKARVFRRLRSAADNIS